MTETDPRRPFEGDLSEDPRRLTLGHLAARLGAGLATQAAAYDAAAAVAAGALREALAGLARSKRAQAADLGPLARALGLSIPVMPSPSGPAGPPSWGVILGEAFQAERALEGTAREMAGLALGTSITAVATRLGSAVAGDGAQVRRLYLRYS